MEEIATSNNDVRLRPAPEAVTAPAPPEATISPVGSTSPDDRLEIAVTEIRSTVAAELLEALAQSSPSYFETVVLDLLHRMGYGTSRNDVQRVGGSGDGGIDGVISIDFAKSVEKIVLVDGSKLTQLMIDFEVGVTLRPVRVPKLDSDYFDE